jgi:XTP/dITP diphosphohydrolase
VRLVLSTRNAHKVASSGRSWRRTRSSRCPTTSSCRRDRRDVRRERARQGARRRRGDRDDRDRRRLGDRRRGPRRAPGVRSARFAGEDATDEENLAKLLREAPAGSGLAYVCALAYVDPDGTEHVVEGRCEGTLAADPRGTGGFGYDPAFVPVEHGSGGIGSTMAELPPEEKDAISHRGRAARALLQWLEERQS